MVNTCSTFVCVCVSIDAAHCFYHQQKEQQEICWEQNEGWLCHTSESGKKTGSVRKSGECVALVFFYSLETICFYCNQRQFIQSFVVFRYEIFSDSVCCDTAISLEQMCTCNTREIQWFLVDMLNANDESNAFWMSIVSMKLSLHTER